MRDWCTAALAFQRCINEDIESVEPLQLECLLRYLRCGGFIFFELPVLVGLDGGYNYPLDPLSLHGALAQGLHTVSRLQKDSQWVGSLRFYFLSQSYLYTDRGYLLCQAYWEYESSRWSIAISEKMEEKMRLVAFLYWVYLLFSDHY